MDMPIPSTDTGAAEGDGLVLTRANASGTIGHTPLPPALAERLATPAPAAATLDERLDALLEGYALEIGAAAMRGDIKAMERAQRFHRQVVQMRDHWRSGNDSPVRLPKAAKAAVPAAAIAEVRA
ncbi:MAG: hypothetical protein K2X46_06890 [Roseomonas sp.]|nr:hypothetical protein [Roseomonas sp.]